LFSIFRLPRLRGEDGIGGYKQDPFVASRHFPQRGKILAF